MVYLGKDPSTYVLLLCTFPKHLLLPQGQRETGLLLPSRSIIMGMVKYWKRRGKAEIFWMQSRQWNTQQNYWKKMVGNVLATPGNTTFELQSWRNASHCHQPICTSFSTGLPFPAMELSVHFFISQQFLINKFQLFCKSGSFYCKW